jgi:hypothetical protein
MSLARLTSKERSTKSNDNIINKSSKLNTEKFVIPKRVTKELLTDADEDDRLGVNEVANKFNCCKSNTNTGYELKQVQNVSNQELEKIYA